MTTIWALLQKILDYSPQISEKFFTCTTCGYCRERCANDVNVAAVVEAFRADLIKAGTNFQPYKDILDSIEKNSNPFWEPHEKRREWLPVTGVKPSERADILYYAGCTASYRVMDTAQAMVKIFKKTGIPFTMLQDEICCGSTLIRIGYLDQAKQLAKELTNRIEGKKVSRVVTSCAGCFRALQFDYPKIVGKLPFEVLHATEFLKELIEEKKLDVRGFKKTTTWHDPCHLGRHAKVYEAPRDVVASFAPKFVEMRYNKEHSYCCGAGGGFRKARPDLSLTITQERIRQAKEVGAEVLVTCCPFCYNSFKTVGGMEFYDLPVFIAKILGL